jgi:hypothetical protein
MGMGYGANYGYCVELTDELRKKIGITEEDWEKTGYGSDMEPEGLIYDKIEKFLGTNAFWLYLHTDGDRYDGMEEDGLYIIFDQEFLFGPPVKTLGYHQVATALGVEPQHKLWVTFG